METAIIPLYAQVWWLLSHMDWYTLSEKPQGRPWRPGQQGQACIKILHYQQPGAKGEEVAAKTSLQGAALFQLTVKSSKLSNTSQLGQLDASILQARSVHIYSKKFTVGWVQDTPRYRYQSRYEVCCKTKLQKMSGKSYTQQESWWTYLGLSTSLYLQ